MNDADKFDVSVIIPTFNAEKFLEETIQCVLNQSFQNWELLLIDDGSSDTSPTIAQRYAAQYPNKIRYLEHPDHANQGPLATRMLGAQHAHANVLALLDADDLWEKDYLQNHLSIWNSLQAYNIAASYGPGLFWFPDDSTETKDFVQPMPPGIPRVYQPGELLKNFFSTKYATTPCTDCLLIRRNIFLELEQFKEIAKDSKCFEDQFLSWYVAIHYPIAVHNNVWVRYRQHETSSTAIQTADDLRQIELIFLRAIKKYLEREIPQHSLLKNGSLTDRIQHLSSSWTLKASVRKSLKDHLPDNIYLGLRNFYRLLYRLPQYPSKIARLMSRFRSRMRLDIGVEPLSYNWGYDRGLPILRYYTEQFLWEFAADIRGHCLEFQEDSYTSRFGGNRVSKLDILHLDESNPKVTLIADLTKPNDIPGNTFDCIICTYVLHVIFELDKVIEELYRILNPRGVLLVVVPHISMSDPECHELWRFTDEGLYLLLTKVFGKDNVTIRAYGNSLTAAGSIRGLAAHEFTKTELDYSDPRFALEICARAVKDE